MIPSPDCLRTTDSPVRAGEGDWIGIELQETGKPGPRSLDGCSITFCRTRHNTVQSLFSALPARQTVLLLWAKALEVCPLFWMASITYTPWEIGSSVLIENEQWFIITQ